MKRCSFRYAALGFVSSFLATGLAEAAELKIFGSRVTQVMVGELAAVFEKSTGLKPVVEMRVVA